MNRKQFFKLIARIGILGAMTGLIVYFEKQGRITLYSECTGSLKCKSCNSLSRCSLPEAKTLKENGEG